VEPAPKAIGRFTFAGKAIGYELKEGSVSLIGPFPNFGEIDSVQKAEEAEVAYKAVCGGSATAPKAASGYLCLYNSDLAEVENAVVSETAANRSKAATEFGITVPFEFSSASDGYIRGTWAVTG
jgi:hypothetical protein